MSIDFNHTRDPVAGVSLIKGLSIDIQKPFSVDEIFVKPRSKTPVDQHKVAEFWRILSGQGKLFYQDKIHMLDVGDWFMFYPHEAHQVENETDSTLVILSIYWDSLVEDKE
ncbi:MAG: cupin domain-containing protein [Gammaproteobacteria bacterium]|nr:cupin domain-containing protein [Gammaproteobacteria bacterium]